MKRFVSILVFCMSFCLQSCYDDSALWESIKNHEERIVKLETLCGQMNTNVSSLQTIVAALQDKDYVTNVAPINDNGVQVGYTITFSKSGSVTIYHGNDGNDGTNGKDGIDGHTPIIGVKQDTDNAYYWTLDGEWILDNNGNKIPTTGKDGQPGMNGTDGVTPKLKITDDCWYITYNNGETWEKIGSAVPEDARFFKDVVYVNDLLTLTLANGEVISFKVGNQLRIVFGEYDPNWGTEIEIPYTVEGAIGEPSVYIIEVTGDYYGKIVENTPYSGVIKIDIGGYREEIYKKLYVFVSDESGVTVSKVIKLASGVLYTEDSTEYLLSHEAQQISVKFSTNRNYEVSTTADWITLVNTKAVEEKSLVFDISENEGAWRQGNIEIVSGNEKIVFTVSQNMGGDNVFYLNLKYDGVRMNCNDGYTSTGSSLSIYLDRHSSWTLLNKQGKTLAEVMGYSSWDELAQAIGGPDAVQNNSGKVTVTAYDIENGKPSDEGLDRAYGGISAYFGPVSLQWYANNGFLNYYFSIYDPSFDLPPVGESYSYCLMLSSGNKQAYICINLEIIEYDDPEKDKYTDPAAPGRYEYDIKDVVEIMDVYDPVYVYDRKDVFETIKQILGMTTFDIYSEHYNSYFIIGDETVQSSRIHYIDINGFPTTTSKERVMGVDWYISATSAYLRFRINRTKDASINRYVWSPMVIEAAENNTVIKYKYVFECRDYELIFNHEVELVRKEYDDPEVGRYDNPFEPGDYEFDFSNMLELISEVSEVPSASYSEMWETVKKVLGKTTFELYNDSHNIQSYYLLDNNTKYEDTYIRFDADGDFLSTESDTKLDALRIRWNIFDIDLLDNYTRVWAPYNYNETSQSYVWTASVREAAEKGLTVKYKYVIEYNGYKLTFNHKIKYMKADAS